PMMGISPSISANGNVVVYGGSFDGQPVPTPDTPVASDGHIQHLYARNLSAGTTVLVDTDVPGHFTSDRATRGAGGAVSADGRYVAFGCACERIASGPDSVEGHLGIFRADLTTRDVIEVDANVDGLVTNQDAVTYPTSDWITADGSQILFGSAG